MMSELARHGFGLLFLTTSLLFPQEAENGRGFFTLRSQSPVQQLRVGIQHHPPWTLAEGQGAFHIQHTWKNMWLYKTSSFLIDGEIHETVFRGAYGFTPRFELSTEVPVRFLTGGHLDALIEGFHDTFGYVQAGRDKYLRNQFAVQIYDSVSGTSFSLDDSEIGWQLGNIILSASYDLIQDKNPRVASAISGNLKLPTASTRHLFGSQSFDFGLSLGLGYTLSPMHIYYNGGIIYYGDSDILGIELRQWHFSTLIGFEYRKPDANYSWILQGLVESGVAKDYEEFTKRTSELVLGYKYYHKSGWVFGVGILENIFYYDNSPDVALHLELTRFFKLKEKN